MSAPQHPQRQGLEPVRPLTDMSTSSPGTFDGTQSPLQWIDGTCDALSCSGLGWAGLGWADWGLAAVPCSRDLTPTDG